MRRVTILTAFVLALMVSASAYGSISHGPGGDPDDGGGNVSLFHGPGGDPDDGGGN